MIACVAIVGKANNPLYVKSFNSQTDDLKFHFIIHSALDLVEIRNAEGYSSGFLGLLYPTENFRVYGFVTNTRIKLFAVVDDSSVKEIDVKQFFDRFHTLYVKTVSNPFHNFDEEIDSSKFQVEIARLVAQSS